MTGTPSDYSSSSLEAAIRIVRRNKLLALPFVLVGVVSAAVTVTGLLSPIPVVADRFSGDILIRLSMPRFVPVVGSVHLPSSALAGMRLPYLAAVVVGTIALLGSVAVATAQTLWWVDGNDGLPPAAGTARLVGYGLATTGALFLAETSSSGDALTLFGLVTVPATYAFFFVPVPLVLENASVVTAMKRSTARFVVRPVSNVVVVIVVANIGHLLGALTLPLETGILRVSVAAFATVAIGGGLHAIVLLTAYRRSIPWQPAAANQTPQPADD